MPGVWVTLVYNNGGNREQKRSGQEPQAGGQENPKRSLSSSPGPRNNRVGSGCGRVESSRVKSRQGKSRTSRSTSKQSKQASVNISRRGVWRKEREGADMCFPYVVHKSWAQCKQASAGQDRTGQGRVERRKEAGSKYMEGRYVRMDGGTQVCMYQCHIL